MTRGCRRAPLMRAGLTALLAGVAALSIAIPARADVTTPTPPAPPPVPAAPLTSSHNSALGLRWPVVPTATSYRVEVSGWPTVAFAPVTSGSCAGSVPPPVSGDSVTCEVGALTNGQVYLVRVVALVDSVESAPSEPSAPSVPATVPGSPSGLRVTPAPRALTATWQVPADRGGAPLLGYRVDVAVGTGAFAAVPACPVSLARSCTLAGLKPGTRYAIRVTALNRRGGSEPAGPVTATPLPLGDVVLAFGGDVHFSGSAEAQAGPGGLRTLPRVFAGADVSMVNLETALVKGSAAAVDKEFVFRAPPSVLRTLADAGVDVVTMANNHGVDFGATGLASTLAARAHSPVPIVGVGANTADAIAPWTTTVRGTSIAYFGIVGLDLTEEENAYVARTWPARSGSPGLAVWKDHRDQILAAVHEWSQKVDIVVVYAHWGWEMATCPNRAQRAAAAALAHAGADVIVGAHPHVLQGGGWRGRTVVAYSLGNFAWYSAAGRPSAALMVTVRNGQPVSYEWRPTTYTGSGLPITVSGGQARDTRALLAERSACTGLAPARMGLTSLVAPGSPLTCSPLRASEQPTQGFE